MCSCAFSGTPGTAQVVRGPPDFIWQALLPVLPRCLWGRACCSLWKRAYVPLNEGCVCHLAAAPLIVLCGQHNQDLALGARPVPQSGLQKGSLHGIAPHNMCTSLRYQAWPAKWLLAPILCHSMTVCPMAVSRGCPG